MLTALSIRDIVLVDALDLEVDPHRPRQAVGLEHLARTFIEDAAILGRLKAAGGAIEEAHGQMPLQFRNPGRGDGGRGALIPGSRTHPAQFIDTDEHFQVGNIGHSGFARFLKVIGDLQD